MAAEILEGGSETTCEACGEKFSCGANLKKCWCFAVEVPEEKAAKLGKHFHRCLCPHCLKSVVKSGIKFIKRVNER